MSNKIQSSYRPNYAIPPGETLRETIEAYGMSQAELAERTGRPKKTISEIITAKAAITAETALQLERVLGIPASFWNNLERNYQEAHARIREEEHLQAQVAWLKNFPITQLVKLGWISKEDEKLKQLQVLLNFFGVAGIEEWKAVWTSPQAAYRKSEAFKSSPFATAAWLRKGEIDAAAIQSKPHDAAVFEGALNKIRTLTNKPPETFTPEMVKLCAEAGVAVTFVPELPGTRVYGVTRWLNPGKALIQLSLRGKSDDHLWFTFFHEAGHILYHGKREVFIEEKDKHESKAEQEADRFAQDVLIPAGEYKAFLSGGSLDNASINRFAKKIGIASGIVVGRLQHDNAIHFSKGNSLKTHFRFTHADTMR
ncbi:MAG: HigA family addiction module antitoxin [Nitrospirae bacterium]|nr:HigA family addiction module antitoxin [Nitrospirota bacterium]